VLDDRLTHERRFVVGERHEQLLRDQREQRDDEADQQQRRNDIFWRSRELV